VEEEEAGEEHSDDGEMRESLEASKEEEEDEGCHMAQFARITCLEMWALCPHLF
jgi:hypothetical protein